MGKPTFEPRAEGGGERTRRLSDVEREALLDRLDQIEGLEQRDGVPLLRGNRAPWRRHDIALEVEHPGGGLGQFVVSTHSLSPDRLTLLHLGFLHRQTRCAVHLPTVWDTFERVDGKVDLCDHVSGPVHRVDMRFDNEVELRQYLDKGPVLTKLTQQSSDSGSLSGLVLQIEAEATIRETTRFLLRQTRLELSGWTRWARPWTGARRRCPG